MDLHAEDVEILDDLLQPLYTVRVVSIKGHQFVTSGFFFSQNGMILSILSIASFAILADVAA